MSKHLFLDMIYQIHMALKQLSLVACY